MARRRVSIRAGLAVLLLCAAPDARGGDVRPDLVLITLDTTRADRLGCYGYARDTSPHLDALAADGSVHTRAYSTSSWTLPAHASLFTGLFPSSHGARYDPEGPLLLDDAMREPAGSRYRVRGLSGGTPTLAERLAGAGFATGAVVAGPWMKRLFGLDRGFAHYDDAQISSVRGRTAAQVTDAAVAWLDRQAGERVFLFLNYYDPHSPYEDPEGLVREFLAPGQTAFPRTAENRNAAYDGEIKYMDRHLGRLLDRLRANGRYENAWIVVTADHGELLGEHGELGHGASLYEEEIRIPLVVKPPPGAAPLADPGEPIQLTDVAPLLLHRLGVEPSPPGGGAPLLAEVDPLPPRERGAQPALQVDPPAPYSGSWRALFDGPYKLHWSSLRRHRLFHVARDPGESNDLAAREPERVRVMSRRLEDLRAALPRPEPAGPLRSVDEQTRRALESLGYLE